jgi:hypothetical protein
MQPPDKIMWSRYEIKYLIDEIQAARIIQWMRPFIKADKNSRYQNSRGYPIVSLYLDSKDLRLFHDTAYGVKNRFKLRIRSYNDNPESARFAEIKRRVNNVIIKSRARIKEEEIPFLINGSLLPDRFDHNNKTEETTLDQFQFYLAKIGAKPMARIRYLREAYESITTDDVRVTFDRNLAVSVTQTPDIRFHDGNWQPFLSNKVVLEIKFTGCFPSWVAQAVQSLELKQQSVAKYVSGLRYSCSLGYCAPRIFPRESVWTNYGKCSKTFLPSQQRHPLPKSSFPSYSPLSSDRSSHGSTTILTAGYLTLNPSSNL